MLKPNAMKAQEVREGKTMLKPNAMIAKLYAGQPAIGIGVNIPSPQLVEMWGYCGFDWVLLDCEHGSMTLETIEQMVWTAEISGMVPIVRPTANDPEVILGYLERGVMGIRAPHVMTKEEAQGVVEAVKFHPLGMRGMSTPRGATYGIRFSQREYIDWWNKESFVSVMIEHIDAVRNLEAILTVEGVDVVAIGASDLSQSMGLPVNHPEVQRVVDEILGTILGAGRIAGRGGSPEQLVEYASKGMNLLHTHTHTLLSRSAKAVLEGVRQKASSKG